MVWRSNALRDRQYELSQVASIGEQLVNVYELAFPQSNSPKIFRSPMCGAIRYECSAKPIAMGLCHCRDCQRATGSAFAAALMVPRNTVTISGEVKYYEVIGDSGNPISRGFCNHCGSRLFGSRANADFISIQAGSLDDPSWFKPQVDLYVSSAQPWDYLNPDLTKFAKFPPPNNSNPADV